VSWDPEHPKIERLDSPEGERFVEGVIVHKPDCPAGHPAVDNALRAAYA